MEQKESKYYAVGIKEGSNKQSYIVEADTKEELYARCAEVSSKAIEKTPEYLKNIKGTFGKFNR